jgi:uncharacterized iron-regulated membrane protein
VSGGSSLSDRVWNRPQSIWLRRALFQAHLWSGIAVGLYLLIISISGSALVFRIELHNMFNHPPAPVTASGERMTDDQLKDAAVRVFPGYAVSHVWPQKDPNKPIEIWLEKERVPGSLHRIFNPYTGQYLGFPDPAMVRFIVWLASLHDELLFGEKGRTANGVGAISLTVLCVTGLIIWWPGVTGWRRSLTVDVRSNWKLINWHLHSAVGMWGFLLTLLWAISGIYLAFPNPFQNFVDYMQPLDDAKPQTRSGDVVLQWLSRLHFGRFGGWPIKALWTVTGLIPLLLFITGAVMWWNRVLRPRFQREYAAQS